MKSITRTVLKARITRSKREHREHAGAIVFVFAFTLIMFAPVLRGKTFSMVGAHMYGEYPWTATVRPDPEVGGLGYPQTDHAETFYPNSVFVTHAIRSGQLPLWFPYSFGGLPLSELGLNGFLYPPRLLTAGFLEPITQHDFLLFTHLLLAGIGMYALLRLWGANAFGAILGAMVWELNGHNAFWLVVEHIAFAAAWLPLSLLAATLAIRRLSFRWAVAAGAALGVALLSGSFQYVYLGALVLAAWYGASVVLVARKQLTEGRRRSALIYLSLPVCSAIVAAALSAATWLPMSEWLSHIHREQATLQAQLAFAIPLKDFAGALIRPQSAAGPAGKEADFPSFAFTGILAVILAIPALLRPRAAVLLGALVCFFSLGFALGFAPFVSVLRLLPYFGTMHPHSGFYLFSFAIGTLAAFGITEAGRRLSTFKLPGLILFLLGCMLLVVEARQLIVFARAINPVQPERVEWLFPETPLITALRRLQGEYRILPVNFHNPKLQWFPPVFAGKVAANFDLRSGSGYESLLPIYTAGLWRTIEQGGVLATDIPAAYRPYFYHDRLPLNLLEKVSVGLLVTPPIAKPLDITGRDPIRDGTLQLVYQGVDGLIYKDTHALPRAFLVPHVVPAPDPATSLRMLVDPNFDARDAAIVLDDKAAAQATLPLNDSPSAKLDARTNIVSDRLNDLEIEAVTPRTSVMVLNDSWAPGWKAYVDGVEQPVLRVNYAFRGVKVPEGQHRIVFLYRPPLLLIGLTISSIMSLLIVILYVQMAVRSLYRGWSFTLIKEQGGA